MSLMSVMVTPFEHEVLQVLASYPFGVLEECETIKCNGWTLFGPDWGGQGHMRKSWYGTITYPKINFALGRLRKKGLVRREDTSDYSEGGYQAGVWGLSQNGAAFMGIDFK